jgi:hypothetical protein
MAIVRQKWLEGISIDRHVYEDELVSLAGCTQRPNV